MAKFRQTQAMRAGRGPSVKNQIIEGGYRQGAKVPQIKSCPVNWKKVNQVNFAGQLQATALMKSFCEGNRIHFIG